MCSASAGNRSPHSGQRYVAGLVLAAGRTAYQRAEAKSSMRGDVYPPLPPPSRERAGVGRVDESAAPARAAVTLLDP